MLDFDIPMKEIERRKQVVRDVWEYKKVDHIPIMMSVDYNPWNYSMHDELYDSKKQLQLRLLSVKNSLELIPDDYIPSMFINVGCVAIASALGAEIYKGENKQQTPGVKKPIINKIDDIYKLKIPNPREDGMVAQYVKRMKYFLEETDYKIAVSGLDMNGPFGVAMDILGSELVYIMMYEAEEDLKYLLNFVADTIIKITDVCIEEAGDMNCFTSLDFFYSWCPEGKKGHVSSDLCASYFPELFKKYDIPVNSRIFEKYGGGLLHNCGPNPCVYEYLKHCPEISGVNLSYNYSYKDLPMIKEAFKGKGIVYFFYEGEPESAVAHYRDTMEALAPDVIAIPMLSVTDPKYDIKELYNQFYKISREYARRIWG
jgi:uroporphyrinogen-III decarboxylase